MKKWRIKLAERLWNCKLSNTRFLDVLCIKLGDIAIGYRNKAGYLSK